MPIRHLCLFQVSVPRIYETRVSRFGGHAGPKTGSDYILLEIGDDNGLIGVGEVSDVEPTWGIESWSTCKSILVDGLIGTEPGERASVVAGLAEALPPEWHRELRCALTFAVDMALIDLAARKQGVAACALLGGRRRQRLPVSWVAYIRDAQLMEPEIEEKVAAGFRAFKLKVGDDLEQDLDRIRTLRRIAGPEAYLKVDASGAWELAEAVEVLQEMAECGVDAVETPLRSASRHRAKNEPETVNQNIDAVARELARLRDSVPMHLIEHVADFDDAFAQALITHAAVDVFNIVPCQAGDLERARRLVGCAQAGGLDVLFGSTVELGPGTAAALHLAAGCGITAPSDLVGPGLLSADVVAEDLAYHDGQLPVPQGPGLGVTLDAGKLESLNAITID